MQNSLARIVTSTKKHDHITPVLKKNCIGFQCDNGPYNKTAMLTHKSLNIGQPEHLVLVAWRSWYRVSAETKLLYAWPG